MEDVDHKVSLIPDFISNCGMARFCLFTWKESTHDWRGYFQDTSTTKMLLKNAQIKQFKNKCKRYCLEGGALDGEVVARFCY
jgi:hypothetical protein